MKQGMQSFSADQSPFVIRITVWMKIAIVLWILALLALITWFILSVAGRSSDFHRSFRQRMSNYMPVLGVSGKLAIAGIVFGSLVELKSFGFPL